MQSRYRAACAFLVCFIVGASGSVLLGLDSRIWVPAGLSTSTLVAFIGYRAGRKRNIQSDAKP